MRGAVNAEKQTPHVLHPLLRIAPAMVLHPPLFSPSPPEAWFTGVTRPHGVQEIKCLIFPSRFSGIK